MLCRSAKSVDCFLNKNSTNKHNDTNTQNTHNSHDGSYVLPPVVVVIVNRFTFLLAACLPGVQNVLLRNTGGGGRRLNAVDAASGRLLFVGVLLRLRNGLAMTVAAKCLLGVFTLDGVRVFCGCE